MGKSELVLYQPDNSIAVEVRLEDENVWLNRQQISVLFDRDIKTIGKHINNALNEELANFSVVANFATTAADGKVYQVEYYNLDMILSIGYRVKSNRGIQFRIWANHVLKNYLMKGYAVNKRFERLENRVTKTEEKIDFFVKTALPPVQGIFYEGQIFDAYIFASNLIKSAKKSIVLIDNYIDESVLFLLSKRQTKVSAQIYTKRISAQLQLDLKKHNSQYEPIHINTSDAFHDRFLVIDNTVYFIGASLKDLGKKLFAFSKMEIKHTELLSARKNGN
ncbi:virulence RhuM family protein [Treponema sp. R80B11-R83G3]